MTSSLIKLAQDETVEARRQLFAEVSRLVAADLDDRSDTELALFAEVMLKLYSNSTAEDRLRLAQKLAPCSHSPSDLVLRIAKDEVRVAMPVLADSPLLSQEDLLDLIEQVGETHMQVLARRKNLPTEVSDVLVNKGDRPVQRILAGNREIKLSRDTMLKLVKLAAEDELMREDLALRSDLSPAVCQELLPLVDDETKKRLRNIIEGSLSQEQLDQIARLKVLRRTFSNALESQDVGTLWREAERSAVTLDELMILLLQDGRFSHAIELLSARGRIAQSSLRDAIYNGKLDVVLRTATKAGLNVPAFALLAKARCAHLKISPAQGAEWTSAYVKQIASSKARQHRCEDFQTRRRARS
ncbi:DUF2336 domain-containing protein [Roseibium sp. MMSF_3544]|uniref:DUF2336 domain-containing protein n=1 Tax=unclassified Roseibium TaxID=2629323 RepID=UPI00273DCB4F|nr:DUF2336 domain-containing protein [Roseibium sp. MMSF_3544]